jgi:hypothetical protein
MANTKSEGTGEASDASAATQDGDAENFEEGSREDHEAAIKEKLRDEANQLVESAQTAVERAEEHLAGAKEALKEAKANRSELGDK